MSTPVLLLALAVLGAGDPTTPTTAEQALAARFVSALASGEPTAVASTSASGALDGPAWRSVRDTLERYRQVSVGGFTLAVQTEDGARILRLGLDASGVVNNARQPRRSLPTTWYLRAELAGGELRLAGAETAERALGRALLTAVDDHARSEILAVYGPVDLRVVLEEVADQGLERIRRGEEPEARPSLQQAILFFLAQAVDRGDAAVEAVALGVLGLSLDRSEAAAAVSLERAAVALAQRSGDCDALALTRHWLAIRMHHALDPDAPDVAAGVAALLESLDDPRIALRARGNQSSWEQQRGNLRASLAAAEAAGRDARRYGFMAAEGFAHSHRADIYRSLRQLDLAAEELRLSVAALRRAGYAQFAGVALTDLGNLALQQGRIEEGEGVLAEAMEVGAGPSEAWWLQYMAAAPIEALLAAGRLEEASARLDRFHLASPAEPQFDASFAAASVRLAQGRPREALALLQAAPLFRSADQDWKASHLLGRIERDLGQLAKAEAALRKAVDTIESHRATLPASEPTRAAFLEDKLGPFRDLIDLLAQEGRVREAFVVAERMRAQSLTQILEQGHVDLSLRLTPSETLRGRELEDQLEVLNRRLLAAPQDPALRAQLSTARQELERFRSDLHVRHSGWEPQRGPEEDPLLAAEEALPLGATVLEFVVLERQTLLFVIRRAASGPELELHRLPIARGELERRVVTLLGQLEKRDAAYSQGITELSALLLVPVDSLFGTVSELSIVPDGVLWNVPFHLLRDRQGKQLIERVAIFKAPSLAVLGRLRKSPRATPPRVLAMGNPAIGGASSRQLPALSRGLDPAPLPQAEREVFEIARLYGDGAKVHIGGDASEHRFKNEAASFDVIHLASHGMLDDSAPLYSAVLLSPGEGEDGVLEMREIADLHLRARLVVLSACETGRGRLTGGEGVIGLAWATMAAGVPTTVVAEWKADSAATAALMVELHRQLLANASPAEALRRAQLALSQQPSFRHPYYWAPFTVVGDGWTAFTPADRPSP